VRLERGPLSLVSTTEELLARKSSGSCLKAENTAVEILHADHVEPSIRQSWHKLRRQEAEDRSLEDSGHAVPFVLVSTSAGSEWVPKL
jgi:hypothetical protein